MKDGGTHHQTPCSWDLPSISASGARNLHELLCLQSSKRREEIIHPGEVPCLRVKETVNGRTFITASVQCEFGCLQYAGGLSLIQPCERKKTTVSSEHTTEAHTHARTHAIPQWFAHNKSFCQSHIIPMGKANVLSHFDSLS